MNEPFSAAANAVWHQLFATAPLEVLDAALDAGMVPDHCWDAEGRDLLFTALNRPLGLGFGGLAHADQFEGKSVYAPSLELLRSGGPIQPTAQVQLAQFLLRLVDRPDARPWMRLPSTLADLKGKEATAVDLALGWHVPALVQAALERADAPVGSDLVAWNNDLSGQPATPGHRSQLALAVHRHQGVVIHALLAKGLDINALDKDGDTVLFSASSPSVVKFLLQRGADPSVSAGKRTLVEHWAQKLGHGFSQSMIALVLSGTRSTPQDAAVAALAWVEKNSLSVSSYSGLGSRSMADWKQGWETASGRVGDALPMNQWVRQVPSGAWKGKVSLLGQVGISMVEMSLGDSPSVPVTLAVMPSADRLVEAPPVVMRRGLTDHGVFAVGAYRLLTTRLYRNEILARRKPGIVPKEHETLLRQTGERVEAMLAALPQQHWDTEWVKACAVLQKSPRREISGSANESWDERFAYEDNRKDGLGVGAQIALAEKGWLAGVDLASSDFLVRMSQWATLLANSHQQAAHGPALAQMLLAVLGNSQELRVQEVQEGWKALQTTLLGAFASPTDRAAWLATIDEGLKAVAMKQWEGTPLGREMALEDGLPQPVAPRASKPRF